MLQNAERTTPEFSIDHAHENTYVQLTETSIGSVCLTPQLFT